MCRLGCTSTLATGRRGHHPRHRSGVGGSQALFGSRGMGCTRHLARATFLWRIFTWTGAARSTGACGVQIPMRCSRRPPQPCRPQRRTGWLCSRWGAGMRSNATTPASVSTSSGSRQPCSRGISQRRVSSRHGRGQQGPVGSRCPHTCAHSSSNRRQRQEHHHHRRSPHTLGATAARGSGYQQQGGEETCSRLGGVFGQTQFGFRDDYRHRAPAVVPAAQSAADPYQAATAARCGKFGSSSSSQPSLARRVSSC